MLEMRGSRTLPLTLAVLVAVALVAPALGQACAARERSCCPGMPPELAALCQQTQAEGMSVPGCCDREAPAPAPAGSDAASQAVAASALLANATATAFDAAPSVVPPAGRDRAYSRTGSRHELGLFTLHAVFLI